MGVDWKVDEAEAATADSASSMVHLEAAGSGAQLVGRVWPGAFSRRPAIKVVIWILACVVLVGCESRRLEPRRVESSNGVTLELATAVRRALEAQ